jgi:hypothetical protein
MWQALETEASFIGQVITGDNAARCAEDIGGQELSYAEVKAIASGNPAVLTLAEADAELQWLNVLKKNHLDEQFLARRSVRDLPATIRSLDERITKLRQDRHRLRLPQRTPPIVVQRSSLVLDRIKTPDHLENQRRFRRRRRPRVEELSARMRPARHFDNPPIRARVNSVIPAERVGLQISRVVRQELRRPVALTIHREVIDIVGKYRATNVHPEPPRVTPPLFAPEHRYRRVISPDHRPFPRVPFGARRVA